MALRTTVFALALFILSDCLSPSPAHRPIIPPPIASVLATHGAGDPFEGAFEFDVGPSDAPRPLLIALHGRGDRPENFAALFRTLTVPVHVRALRAPMAMGEGFTWFGTGGADWNDRYLDALARVVRGLAPRAGERFCGRPVVVGFSQGAMLAYGVALVAPTATAAVFPLSGELPTGIRRYIRRPRAGEVFGAVYAEHGDADAVIRYDHASDATGYLRANEYDATLETEPGEGHTVNETARTWLMRTLERVLRAQC